MRSCARVCSYSNKCPSFSHLSHPSTDERSSQQRRNLKAISRGEIECGARAPQPENMISIWPHRMIVITGLSGPQIPLACDTCTGGQRATSNHVCLRAPVLAANGKARRRSIEGSRPQFRSRRLAVQHPRRRSATVRKFPTICACCSPAWARLSVLFTNCRCSRRAFLKWLIAHCGCRQRLELWCWLR